MRNKSFINEFIVTYNSNYILTKLHFKIVKKNAHFYKFTVLFITYYGINHDIDIYIHILLQFFILI